MISCCSCSVSLGIQLSSVHLSACISGVRSGLENITSGLIRRTVACQPTLDRTYSNLSASVTTRKAANRPALPILSFRQSANKTTFGNNATTNLGPPSAVGLQWFAGLPSSSFFQTNLLIIILSDFHMSAHLWGTTITPWSVIRTGPRAPLFGLARPQLAQVFISPSHTLYVSFGLQGASGCPH